jgi:hypothetical protein
MRPYTLIYRRPSDRDLYVIDIHGAHSPPEAEQMVDLATAPRSCWARMVYPDGQYADYEPGLCVNGSD